LFIIIDKLVLPWAFWNKKFCHYGYNSVPFYKRTPIFDLPEQIDNPDVGERLAITVGDKGAALLRGHGALVTIKSVKEACVMSTCMDQAARIQLDTSSIGNPK
jgi:ribulose-5-phosphate 4-epimerase/fuculose-1-phosphate aldolase